ncbi:MAG: sn-glycerol-3-phosphate ABC transporter ATP-binding protein UgpC [Aestuariivita sp.]|nr:sn-glycerol-3-phosphate ABC transporter ATP-binding protein UgpC [Aestuariivita sp.]MCY4202004.1 sn-glycerol-3-phosphate ABC transporter ATP-binding protein UgpC [Aestuariivita sp.]MCY4288186.1 sn-glycerol-3-phosphate ABC transporter ATP-binding protein UgpC [Aestuariivita sp.]MCY4346249.1 sn-glycerol-3-phosphate ABC transporter ATP-binding protein UgpC [Aestuariivita sp.]
MPQITLKDVAKRYGDVEAVHGVNLEIEQGEFVVLLGPSGCGKTTTLRMVAGLEDVSDGELKIGDIVVNDVAPKDRGVAMVFQNYALYPHMTVRQNMEFALRPLKLSSEQRDRRVNETSAILEISDLMHRKPAQLSGGQRQRVAMGRAMVRTPSVFLFDEPLSNLDAKLRTQMRKEISRLHKRLKSTVLYVTHDQIEAMTLADKIVIMRDGYVEQIGSPEEIYATPKSVFVATFVGNPSMNVFKGLVRKGRILADGFELPIPSHLSDTVGEEQEIVIGFRPSDIIPYQSDGSNFHKARIEFIEFLGGQTQLNLRLGSHGCVAEVPAAQGLVSGSDFFFNINSDALHFFDVTSGRSLH